VKFAVAALLGFVTADQIAVVENIKFDSKRIDLAVEYAHKAGHELAD
jgi:hypothetical protein